MLILGYIYLLCQYNWCHITTCCEWFFPQDASFHKNVDMATAMRDSCKYYLLSIKNSQNFCERMIKENQKDW